MIIVKTNKRAYTLVEVLIAVSLFASVGLISLTIFINITRIQARLALESAIYEDARFMMERMSRSIRNNAINYEEYFNKAIDADNRYGELYGCYGAQFYNPGIDAAGPLTPGHMGAYCNDGITPYTGQACVVFKPSIDNNTGMYPYYGAPLIPALPLTSNAFCPRYPLAFASICAAPVEENLTNELYLLSPDGSHSTIFALKEVSNTSEYALAMVEKVGEDSNNDGVTENWNNCDGGASPLCCAPGYDCALAVPTDSLESNLAFTAAADIYKGFVPISPLRTTISRLEFRISPGDDPHKAFAEPNSIVQPRVRITLVVQPTAEQLALIGSPTGADIPSLVLQTTVSSRIQSEVKSYLGPGSHGLTGSSGANCQLSSGF